MKVAVLGAGPAGLLAALAAQNNGAQVTIIAPGAKSKISGAQYLHDEIPGIDLIPMRIEYLKVGTVQGYARKVYGNSHAPCSWREFAPGKHTAYPLAAAYEAAWQALHGKLVPATVGRQQLLGLTQNFDLVVSSIPLPTLCFDPEAHKFVEKPVWITMTEPPHLDGKIPVNTIVYNGLAEDKWYRASNIEDNTFTEYPDYVVGGIKVVKPLSTECDCWEKIMRVGRYGKWKKGVLVHHAYWEVEYAVQQMQG